MKRLADKPRVIDKPRVSDNSRVSDKSRAIGKRVLDKGVLHTPPAMGKLVASDKPRVLDKPAGQKLDGRHARAQKNRVAVIEALLSLLREGQLSPSTHDVAERAGVTQRTLFNQFDDVSQLLVAVGEYQLANARQRLPEAPQSGEPQARMRQYVEELCGFLEELSPVRWAALTYTGAPREIRRGIDRMRKLMNDRLAEVLAGCGIELQADPELAQALESALDPTTWRMLRTLQGLPPARARKALVRTCLALLAARPSS